jgi:hypothetical protein
MTSTITSPEDIVNLSLSRIGFKGRIGSLYEGSFAAKKALDVYGQTRDEIIHNGQYEFAERIIAGTLVKQAPMGGYITNPWNPATNPDLPWLYSYAYPTDAIKIRSIRATPLFVPAFDPQHNIFSLGNDTGGSTPQRIILCNVPNALITYAGRVTDVTQWSPDFTEALAAALGRRLAPSLIGLEAAKLALSDEQMEIQISDQNEG